MRFTYPARLRPDSTGELIVSFRDLPECLTSGAGEAEALAEAAEAGKSVILTLVPTSERSPQPEWCVTEGGREFGGHGPTCINSDAPNGAEARAAPEPQASGVPPPGRTCHPAARHRCCARSVRRLGLHARRRGARRLLQHRRRARPDLCPACGLSDSQAARLRANLGRVGG